MNLRDWRKVSVASLAAIVNLVLDLGPAVAGECLSRPEFFQLRSDTVYWRFGIRPDWECLQGLRGNTMVLDGVKVIAPPTRGAVTISGNGFRYRAPAASASDQFKIEVSGQNRREPGTSVIVVDVTVE
jgi:hypothetical protein